MSKDELKEGQTVLFTMHLEKKRIKIYGQVTRVLRNSSELIRVATHGKSYLVPINEVEAV